MPMDDSFAQRPSRSQCVGDMEKQRSRSFAPDEVRVRRAVEISDPHTQDIWTNDAHRPCVAQTERSAGLPWNRGCIRYLRGSEVIRGSRILAQHLKDRVARLRTQ